MSLIRQRKKNLMKAGIIGALLGMVLLVGILTVLYLLFGYGKGQTSKAQIEVYQLVRTMKEGEIITEADLLENKITADSLLEYGVRKSDLIGRKLIVPLKTGTILTKEFTRGKEEISRDFRRVNYDFIKVSDKLQKGDYIDIRISFANGADFILLSKKKVEDLNLIQEEAGASNSLWITTSEEELLRMSSAVVDASLNEGTRIYAIEYLSEYQEESLVNYPVNQVVEELIAEDPNIVSKAKNVLVSALRSELKLQESKGENQTEYNEIGEEPELNNYETNSVYQNGTDSTGTKEQEEIQYLD